MMIAPVLAVTLAAGAAGAALSPSQHPPIDADRPVLADFAQRVRAYADLRYRAARAIGPLRSMDDPAEIRRATDALAAAVVRARAGARQGDIFTPAIAPLIRRAIGATCEGHYDRLLALVNEDLEAPLPPPVVHARWPAGAPLPTMTPDLLAALPPLPPGLQYRFVGRDLVLHDIDANLIVDVLPAAIPTTDETVGAPE
jgi:hypothetical protein